MGSKDPVNWEKRYGDMYRRLGAPRRGDFHETIEEYEEMATRIRDAMNMLGYETLLFCPIPRTGKIISPPLIDRLKKYGIRYSTREIQRSKDPDKIIDTPISYLQVPADVALLYDDTIDSGRTMAEMWITLLENMKSGHLSYRDVWLAAHSDWLGISDFCCHPELYRVNDKGEWLKKMYPDKYEGLNDLIKRSPKYTLPQYRGHFNLQESLLRYVVKVA